MISPKVDTIKNVISAGKNLAMPYEFEIILPAAGRNGSYETGTKFSLSRQNVEDMNVAIRSFTLPARVSAKQSVYYGGPLRQFPYISTYDGEINMTFLMRREDPLLIALHAWQEAAIPTDSRTLQYQDLYTTDMDLLVKRPYVSDITAGVADANGAGGQQVFFDTQTTIKYSLRDVWCESVGAVQMSNESANEPLLFNVVLCYREFKTSGGQDEAVSDRVVGPPAPNGQSEDLIDDGRFPLGSVPTPGV